MEARNLMRWPLSEPAPMLYFETKGQGPGGTMLDAFIIDRIRHRQQERELGDRLPLRIEVPTPPPQDPPRSKPQNQDDDNGGLVDFSI